MKKYIKPTIKVKIVNVRHFMSLSIPNTTASDEGAAEINDRHNIWGYDDENGSSIW